MYRLIIEDGSESRTVFKAETCEKLLKKAVSCRGLKVEDQSLSVEEDGVTKELEFFTPSNINPA